MERLLLFERYLELKKIMYNHKRFKEELQYRMVLWNRYGRRYKMSCNNKDFANDAYEYEVEKRAYEIRLRDYRNG